MYIVEPITRGAASCPRSALVEKVHATRRFFAFEMLISSRELKRVLA
jgi:hypothetical protein